MFLGVVPDKLLTQITNAIDFGQWGDVYVCCSGTFRFERAILQDHPSARLHSNDVSVFTVPVGRWLVGEQTRLTFTGELAFVEDALGDCEYVERLGALLVASDYAKFCQGRENRYKAAHKRHYRNNIDALITRATDKVRKIAEKIQISEFFAGDWLDQARRGIDAGAGIVASPPFYKGGYEAMFKFIDANVDWQQPDYQLFDPNRLEEIIDWIEDSGVPYCIVAAQRFENRRPAIEFQSGRQVPHYIYANTEHASYRRFANKGRPFRYEPVDPAKLSEDTEVEIVETTGDRMTHLKNVYLSKGIMHVHGRANFLVYLDGMLAGGLIYDLSKFGSQDELYLLSDFSLSRDAKLSKLIARMALSGTIIEVMNKRFLNRFTAIVTTAFTSKPVSMKYRGVMELVSRKQDGDVNFLNYRGAVTDEKPTDVYRWWWRKHGRKALGPTGNRTAKGRSKDARAA